MNWTKVSKKRLLYYLIYKENQFKNPDFFYDDLFEREENKEEKERMEKLSKESLKYYKIENDKKNELDKYFGVSKTKI